jgi:hypothetical protein
MSKSRRFAVIAGLILAAVGSGMAGCEQVKSIVQSEPVEYCQPSKVFPDKEVCVKLEYHPLPAPAAEAK